MPVPPSAPPKGPLDGLFGRILVQGVGMLGVAAIVVAVVDDRSEDTMSRLDTLESDLREAHRQRDRMERLSAALTEELDEAAVEAEIVRWQLAYTEERLARLQDAARAHDHTRPLRDPGAEGLEAPLPPGVFASEARLAPPATFVSLDDSPSASEQPGAHRTLDAATAVLALSEGQSTTDAALPHSGLPLVVAPTGTGRSPLLELESLEGTGSPTMLQSVGSQLDRDRAFAVWDTIVDEAAHGECARRSSAAERRCRDRVRRRLMPWGGRAVECMLSGNASADYVSDLRLDQLPTHSVPLENGAVILCDGGLRNLDPVATPRGQFYQ